MWEIEFGNSFSGSTDRITLRVETRIEATKIVDTIMQLMTYGDDYITISVKKVPAATQGQQDAETEKAPYSFDDNTEVA